MTVLFDWSVSREDMALIRKIAKRAVALAKKHDIDVELMEMEMDIEATHMNGNPLRLEALLAADDANFGHDVFGIRRYMDRESGTLTQCFSPRYSAPAATTPVPEKDL